MFGQNQKVAILSHRRSRATVASLWPANSQSHVSARRVLIKATMGQRAAASLSATVASQLPALFPCQPLAPCPRHCPHKPLALLSALFSHRCSQLTALASCPHQHPSAVSAPVPSTITVPRVVIHTDPRLRVAIICICLVETKRSQTAYFQSEPKGRNLRIFSPIQRNEMYTKD